MRDYATIFKRLRQYSENCVAYKLDADFANAVTDAADAIEELLAKVPTWISVEERLPPVYKNVLSCDKYGLVKENYMIPDKSWSVGYHITHWMPLPAPPKEVE